MSLIGVSEKNMRVLIVNEDTKQRDSIKEFIEAAGRNCWIEEAASVNDALEKASVSHYDCVVLGERLPEIGGTLTANAACVSLSQAAPVVVVADGGEVISEKGSAIVDHLAMADLTADRAQVALDNAAKESRRRQEEEDQRFAFEGGSTTDKLTGLGNMKAFARHLAGAIDISTRNSIPAAVLLIDLNGFRMTNEAFGQEVGDRAIRSTALRIIDVIRSTDTLYRIGGDEFAIIVQTNATPEGLEVMAKKVLAAVATPLEVNGNKVVNSACIGIATIPDDGKLPEDLMDAADAALYMAKRDPESVAFYSSAGRVSH